GRAEARTGRNRARFLHAGPAGPATQPALWRAAAAGSLEPRRADQPPPAAKPRSRTRLIVQTVLSLLLVGPHAPRDLPGVVGPHRRDVGLPVLAQAIGIRAAPSGIRTRPS